MNLATMRAFFKYVEQIEYAMGLNFTGQSRSHRLSAVVACYSVDTVCSLLGVVRVPTSMGHRTHRKLVGFRTNPDFVYS